MSMTMIHRFPFFRFPTRVQTAGVDGTAIIDETGEARGYVFTTPVDITIKKVYFYVSTVTSAPTSAYDVRIETVQDTSGAGNGRPTGTLWATGTNDNTQLFNSVGLVTATLTNAASISAGQTFAVIVVAPLTNFGNIELHSDLIGDDGSVRANYSISRTNATAAWGFNATFGTSANHVSILLEDSNGNYLHTPIGKPIKDAVITSFTSASTPDEIGNRFYLPYACEVTGFEIFGDIGANNSFKIYSDTDPVAFTAVMAANLQVHSTGGGQRLTFASIVKLNKGWHRFTYAPTSSSSGCSFVVWECFSTAALDVFTGGGKIYKTSRTDGGAWTDETDKVVLLSPIIRAISQDGGNWGFVK